MRPLSSTTSSVEQTSTSSSSPSDGFFAAEGETFESIGVKSPVLLERIRNGLNLDRPSAVQAATFMAVSDGGDVTVGAETGSGKTLAYLLPLLDDILQRKQTSGSVGYDFCRAIILVPNKELVNQVVRMATVLCGGPQCLVSSTTPLNSRDKPNEDYGGNDDANDGSSTDEKDLVRLAVMPGGLDAPESFRPFRNSIALGGTEAPVDLVISTPAAVAPLGVKPKNIDMFADIETLVIDEADMLLDGGYIRPLQDVMLGFRRADRLDASYQVPKTQHVFVAATLPDMGLRSVDSFLQKRFPHATRVTMAGMHNAKHYGLREQTVWIEEEENRDRMLRLVELLKTPADEGGLEGVKTIVFLNSVDDVDGAHGALE